jgi:hypothetical protein
MSAEPAAGETIDRDLAPDALEARLAMTWGTPPGLIDWLATVDHKMIGRRYIVTAFFFLLLGGVLAIAMRLQLSRPENRLMGADLYNQVFTMHGANMMFLFAVPVMEAVAVYIVPLMGGRETSPSRASTPSRTGYISPVAFCCGPPSRSTWGRILAGSPMYRYRVRSTAPASAPTSGRR